MRKLLFICAILTVTACTGENVASDQVNSSELVKPKATKSQTIFERWVASRAGTGAPVHWIAEGAVYEYPSGKKLFGMIGFDSSTVIWPENKSDPVIHLTRKTFTYTDVKTGEVIREYNGKAVEPIAYPYQLITYRMEDGLIHGDVEQGSGENVRIIKSKNGMRVTELGDDTLFVNASVFLDIPIRNDQRLEAWENYDFFIHDEDKVDQSHQMSWQRFGDLPAWAGEGKAIYHLLSWRVSDTEEFPPAILDWANTDKPKWLVPPRSIAEVREIQSGDAGTNWGE